MVEKNLTRPVDPENVTPDIEKRLKKLDKDVQAFQKIGEDIVALSGVPPVEIRKRIEGEADDIPPEGVKLIEKATNLKKHAEKLEEMYKTGEQPIAEPTKLPEDPEYGKHRKKKFKRFGSDSKWKPL